MRRRVIRNGLLASRRGEIGILHGGGWVSSYGGLKLYGEQGQAGNTQTPRICMDWAQQQGNAKTKRRGSQLNPGIRQRTTSWRMKASEGE